MDLEMIEASSPLSLYYTLITALLFLKIIRGKVILGLLLCILAGCTVLRTGQTLLIFLPKLTVSYQPWQTMLTSPCLREKEQLQQLRSDQETQKSNFILSLSCFIVCVLFILSLIHHHNYSSIAESCALAHAQWSKSDVKYWRGMHAHMHDLCTLKSATIG